MHMPTLNSSTIAMANILILKHAISYDHSISSMIIKKSLNEILQVTYGRVCCLVQKQTFQCRYLLKFDVVSTSKCTRRAPGNGGSLCLIQCCAETILSRTMLNI